MSRRTGVARVTLGAIMVSVTAIPVVNTLIGAVPIGSSTGFMAVMFVLGADQIIRGAARLR